MVTIRGVTGKEMVMGKAVTTELIAKSEMSMKICSPSLSRSEAVRRS